MYFTIRILRNASTGEYSIYEFNYDDVNLAKHQYHQVMANYAYGNNPSYDYVSCEVRTIDGRTIVGPEIDNRIPAPQPEPEPEPEE